MKRFALALLVSCLPLFVAAQLSLPVPGGIPSGTGAGVHGANSPFAPLPARTDVVPWSLLTDVKTRNEKNRILPVLFRDRPR